LNTITSTEFSELRAYNYFILPKDAYKDFLFESVKSKKKISLICNGLKSASQVSPVGYFVSLPHEKEYVDHDIDVYEWQGPTDYEYMHEKVLIFDKNHFFVGSHNLGIGSSNVSSELMLEVYSDEIASHLAQVFDDEIVDSEKTIQANAEDLKNKLEKFKTQVEITNQKIINRRILEMY
jgi:phosphatidylserine/phosphatidylglycerophosphate/cardiolipin synthase-like enzyme